MQRRGKRKKTIDGKRSHANLILMQSTVPIFWRTSLGTVYLKENISLVLLARSVSAWVISRVIVSSASYMCPEGSPTFPLQVISAAPLRSPGSLLAWARSLLLSLQTYKMSVLLHFHVNSRKSLKRDACLLSFHIGSGSHWASQAKAPGICVMCR